MISSASVSSIEATQLQKAHFLLLEDSAVDVELVSEELASSGLNYDLVVVKTQIDFESVLESQPIDLVLADYSLPTFDGISAIGIIQEKYPDIPCILVSGILGEERAIDALRSGAIDYILKRRLECLGPAVKRALREKQERQALQEARANLEESERRFRTSVETMVDPLFVLFAQRKDGFIQDFKVCHLNKAACDYLSISKKQTINRSIYDVVPALRRAAVINEDSSFLQSLCNVVDSKQPFEKEILLQSSNFADQRVVLDIKAAKLNDGIVLTWRDATERYQAAKRREQLLLEAEAARNRAEQDNRFKDDFLTTVSHELRSPLSAIIGWSHILQVSNQSADLIPKALSAIDHNAGVLDKLIEDLLDASRIVQGKLGLHLEQIPLARLEEAVANVVDSVLPTAQSKRIKLLSDSNFTDSPTHLTKQTYSQPDDDTQLQQQQVFGDVARIQQAVRNLLTNAIKFTPPEGQVTVALEKQASHIAISVQDTGIGISDQQLPRLFHRFWQATETTQQQLSTQGLKGLGIGLSITQHIVELHHGSIEVVSDGINQGSTFTLHLPMSSNILGSEERQVDEASYRLLNTTTTNAITHRTELGAQGTDYPSCILDLKILVVEDYVDALEMYKIMLQLCGAEVECATTVDAAIKIFDKFRPDVLISDLALPQKSGYSLIRQIRARSDDDNGDIPAIALTAFSENQYKTRALLAGFQAHIAKPVGLRDIADIVIEVSRRTR